MDGRPCDRQHGKSPRRMGRRPDRSVEHLLRELYRPGSDLDHQPPRFVGRYLGSYNRPGDYFSLQSGPNDYIYVVWTDGRGQNFDIYYARNPGFPGATLTASTNPAGLKVQID